MIIYFAAGGLTKIELIILTVHIILMCIIQFLV